MKKLMKWLVDFSHKYSKKPWLRFETSGIDDHAGVQLDMSWNPAFINHLGEAGFVGVDEQDMVRQFLLAITLPAEIMNMNIDEGLVTSDAHPNLQADLDPQDQRNFIKR